MAGFYIPDRELTYPFQSRWFESDTRILGMSAGGKNGVVGTGCEVTESAIPAGTTEVAGGTVVIDGAPVDVVAQTVGHDIADALLPRFDLMVVYDDGTAAALSGTPDAAPLPPMPDTDSIALAQVFIPANDTAIVDAQIVDKRVFVPTPITSTSWIEVSCTTDLSRSSNATLSADPVLQFPVVSGGTYRAKMTVLFSGAATTATGKWGFFITAPLPTKTWGKIGYTYPGFGAATAAPFTPASAWNQAAGGVNLNSTIGTEFQVYAEFFITAATTGTFSFQWAQVTASTTAMVRKKGSILEYEVV